MSLQVPHRAKSTGSPAATKAVILPLFDVAGHPIIWHCLTAITKVPYITEVCMIGYYDESVFRDFIKDSSHEFPHLKIVYLREYQALGTAGGLYHFRDAILKGRPERFFVLNADVCCSFPLNDMLNLFESKDAEAVILGTRVSEDAASNFGCIVSDAHSRRVLHYVEKPESHISNLINCGVYLFATECIFPSIRSAIKKRTDRPRLVSYPSSENLESSFFQDDEDEEKKNEVLRLEQDILSDLADSKQFFVHETKDFWRQIKTAGSAVPANALYLQQAWQGGSKELATPSANILPPVFIHSTATVDPTAKLGPNVSIGPRAVVGAGARVKETIVLEDAEVKHDACVLYSIIGWNSRVGAWARVEGTPTPINSHTTSIIKNGVKVQSITILGKECGVGDEVRVQNCVCLPFKELKRMSTHHAVDKNQGQTAHKSGIPNIAAERVPYFTPAQNPPSGTASDPQSSNEQIPKLFTPLKIRGLTLQNRIMLSPLCQYSAEDGHMTPWHMAHLGGIISRGPGLAMIEATAPVPEGRITPEDVGIWSDSHLQGPYSLKAVVDFAHSQNQKIAIQIAHAGRKASTVAPWLSFGAVATPEINGWPDNVKAPSAIPYNEDHCTPTALTLDEIEDLKKKWAEGVKRAVKAGFDVVEIHNAHGYLLHEFLSPVSNKRSDKYGGSFENRIRLTLEIVEATRAAMPEGMPLFLRLSASDWLEHDGYEGKSWTCEDSVRLAPLLAERGVDLLDVSSGGIHPAQKIQGGPGYQTPFAKAIKKVVGGKMLVGTVGTITSGTQAEAILTGKGEGSHGETGLDLAIVGRVFQKNPGLVWSWADDLGCEINVANQIRWGFGGRAGGKK
ncbi:putative mannose-1-phosphate guanyltransferase [Amylocarpus encephaloides]|uniref:Mannose-1-phosphate guanyltransferase n=1 Tax=Amylocarpus encephaloides TaxID=45428 RepID=A0A9P7YFM2_9HELO|nr:putative mannose-1-phosphate guanyltransferase [Amylocarpus encephaloides]